MLAAFLRWFQALARGDHRPHPRHGRHHIGGCDRGARKYTADQLEQVFHFLRHAAGLLREGLHVIEIRCSNNGHAKPWENEDGALVPGVHRRDAVVRGQTGVAEEQVAATQGPDFLRFA